MRVVLCWIAGKASSMSRLFAIVGRTVGLLIVAGMTHAYCLRILEKAARLPWFDRYQRLDMGVAVVAGVLACAVVLSLRERNFGGMLLVFVLATTGAVVGVELSEPMWWGSYDHGGETVENAMSFGPLGAVAGYLIANALRVGRRSRNGVGEKEEGE
jgi:hypothetical protein